jgi:hypothetical protein
MRRFGRPDGFAVGVAYVREPAVLVANPGMASAGCGAPDLREFALIPAEIRRDFRAKGSNSL